MSLAPSWAVIDLNAYSHNLAVVRGLIPSDCKVCTAVKANAYGHGLIPVARKAAESGVDMLGVAHVEEGIALREGGLALPVLVLGQPQPEAFDAAVRHHLAVAVSSREALRGLAAAAERQSSRAEVHLKVDTGMGRQGCAPDEALPLAQEIAGQPSLRLAGLMTHFALADAAEPAFTLAQTARLSAIVRSFRAAQLSPGIAHAANSAAIIQTPQAAFQMVRPGLMTYGVWPLESNRVDSPLRPVLRWETRIALTKTLPAGASVGYGCTFRAINPVRIAVLPVGYADGYPFRAGNHGYVLIQGRPCPILGRVSMDQLTVDATGVPRAECGETAVLIGSQGSEEVSAADLAHWGGTIAYDILASIGPRVERRYTG